MRVRTGLILGALLLLMVPFLVMPSPRSLQIVQADGSLVWCAPVVPDDIVQLQFTHSMFGGFVREQWRVTPANQFSRERFVTENAAAAEYYATDGSSYHDIDGYVVPGDPLVLPELMIRVNSRGNHQLKVSGNTIALVDLLPKSTQVRVVIKPESCASRS